MTGRGEQGDPLDRIAAQLNMRTTIGGPDGPELTNWISYEDALALVEVARAARALDNALQVTAPKSAQPWLRKLVPLKTFRSALARLDGGPE